MILSNTTSAEYRFCNRVLEIEKISFFDKEILIKKNLLRNLNQNRFFLACSVHFACSEFGGFKSKTVTAFPQFSKKCRKNAKNQKIWQILGGGYGFFAAAPENQRKRAQMTPGERRAHHKVLHRHHKTHLRVPGGHVDCR